MESQVVFKKTEIKSKENIVKDAKKMEFLSEFLVKDSI